MFLGLRILLSLRSLSHLRLVLDAESVREGFYAIHRQFRGCRPAAAAGACAREKNAYPVGYRCSVAVPALRSFSVAVSG